MRDDRGHEPILPPEKKEEELFVAPRAEAVDPEALLVDVDGFEGPLDLLLTLARGQKVDLRRVSILQLAEQYLAFVSAARKLRIELAADYLVMAAWLAFLKSRLLLPPPDEEEGPSAEELAARLAFRLERLEAMRTAGARLMARDQLGRETFARGEAEVPTVRREVEWTASLAELLAAYARVKTKESYEPLHLRRAPVFALDDAVKRLAGLVGEALDWTALSAWLPLEWTGAPDRRRSALASHFAASLELVKRGEAELRQDDAFGPIMLRARRKKVADAHV
ncbi:segregation/condensation protein A [Pikeienuella piscinae]|uniref:Segregation and condensation protein A n=1 Tax=Pikeienuella piscinae TaxID=2748098 RepID=A0A7M3T5Z9_9RHOB|nr:ScpA family protein [Pikeienuella piscinae]QIE57430.1 segregation/condensation protein A [Pikeienuella piscinae]